MSIISTPTQALIFGSFLYKKSKHLESDLQTLWREKFGDSIYFYDEYCPMKKYYSREMGDVSELNRFFMVATSLTHREALVSGKRWAVDVEERYENSKSRSVNLDIGIISLENVQLATGKNFTHRVHIIDGIYSDLTLLFQKGTFKKLEWSYPDYSSLAVINFMNWCRSYLHYQIKNQS